MHKVFKAKVSKSATSPATRLEAIARRLEAIAIRLEALLLGWRLVLVGWRPSLVGWRPLLLGYTQVSDATTLMVNVFDDAVVDAVAKAPHMSKRRSQRWKFTKDSS